MISGSFVVGKTCQLQWLDAKTPEQRTKTSEKNTQIVDNHGKFHQKKHWGYLGFEKFKQQQIQLYL